jgi:phage tail-like protein
MTSDENRKDPVRGFHYSVNIPNKETGDEAGGFTEISGLTAEMETETYFPGGENNLVYHLPKHVKSTPVVLKRGLFDINSDLLAWIKNILTEGFPEKVEKSDIIIQLKNKPGEPIITWTLHDAFPVKWEISGFNAMENKLMIESVTFNYTYFEMEIV